MRAMAALIKREFLEHRGAFLYAPAVLTLGLFLAMLAGTFHGNTHFAMANTGELPPTSQFYTFGLVGIVGLWSVYLMIALFFYYADSFSADRRNNALLFWKSMPQSDLKVLTSKALAGITLFPALILAFAALTGVLLYMLSLVVGARLPLVTSPAPLQAFSDWVQVLIVGVVYVVISIMWSSPLLGWVAFLSTLFQRWSIPLAFLIPGAVILFERLNTIGEPDSSRPIAQYLGWRFQGVMEPQDAFHWLMTDNGDNPISLVAPILNSVNWIHMGLGVLVTIGFVYLASEYRRRRIEA